VFRIDTDDQFKSPSCRIIEQPRFITSRWIQAANRSHSWEEERRERTQREKTLELLFRLRFAKFKRYSWRALNHTQVRICVTSVIIQPLETGRCNAKCWTTIIAAT